MLCHVCHSADTASQILLPYRLLQLAVLVCLISLALGRVVNVFVPIYYREIGDYLTNTKAMYSAPTDTNDFIYIQLL